MIKARGVARPFKENRINKEAIKMNNRNWYCLQENGNIVGPITLEDVRKMLVGGKLTSRDMIWRKEYGDEWIPISSCRELEEYMQTLQFGDLGGGMAAGNGSWRKTQVREENSGQQWKKKREGLTDYESETKLNPPQNTPGSANLGSEITESKSSTTTTRVDNEQAQNNRVSPSNQNAHGSNNSSTQNIVQTTINVQSNQFGTANHDDSGAPDGGISAANSPAPNQARANPMGTAQPMVDSTRSNVASNQGGITSGNTQTQAQATNNRGNEANTTATSTGNTSAATNHGGITSGNTQTQAQATNNRGNGTNTTAASTGSTSAATNQGGIRQGENSTSSATQTNGGSGENSRNGAMRKSRKKQNTVDANNGQNSSGVTNRDPEKLTFQYEPTYFLESYFFCIVFLVLKLVSEHYKFTYSVLLSIAFWTSMIFAIIYIYGVIDNYLNFLANDRASSSPVAPSYVRLCITVSITLIFLVAIPTLSNYKEVKSLELARIIEYQTRAVCFIALILLAYMYILICNYNLSSHKKIIKTYKIENVINVKDSSLAIISLALLISAFIIFNTSVSNIKSILFTIFNIFSYSIMNIELFIEDLVENVEITEE